MCKSKSKKARSSGWSRSQAYGELRALGTRVAEAPAFSLPALEIPAGLRLGFLDRALDAETGALVKNDTFGSRYRTTHDAQDELLSTASTRHFVQGLLQDKRKEQIPETTWKQWRDAVDLISGLRIPTKFSGFATSSSVMQHPTESGEGVFSTASVFGPHGSLDSARVKYVGKAVKLSREAGESVSEQFFQAARAAIEFSLNHFTAPITAGNVQPFSAKAGTAHADELLQDQLASRERIKDIYVALGGKLRDIDEEETQEESWARHWRAGLPITNENPYPVAPPSPSRVASRKRGRPEETSVEPTEQGVGGGITSESVGDEGVDALSNTGGFLADDVARDDSSPSSSVSSDLLGSDPLERDLLEDEPLTSDLFFSFLLPSAPPLLGSPFAQEVQAGASSFLPSAPPEDEADFLVPSAPPLSESPFAQDDEALFAPFDNFAWDSQFLTDDQQDTFNLQTGDSGNIDDFASMFPSVPTDPIPQLPNATEEPASGGLAEEGGELLLL